MQFSTEEARPNMSIDDPSKGNNEKNEYYADCRGNRMIMTL